VSINDIPYNFDQDVASYNAPSDTDSCSVDIELDEEVTAFEGKN
jgi:hypothetical protein